MPSREFQPGEGLFALILGLSAADFRVDDLKLPYKGPRFRMDRPTGPNCTVMTTRLGSGAALASKSSLLITRECTRHQKGLKARFLAAIPSSSIEGAILNRIPRQLAKGASKV